jgi:enoyl-CoA hydratase/carnithine racemase
MSEPHLPPGELKAQAIGERGQIKLLTLSNPSLRNALSPAMSVAGVEALNHADASPEVRCIVITGEGEHFCAGGNLQRLQYNRTQPPAVQEQSIDSLHAWIEAITTCRKPVIAAIEGACAGAGLSLALACDLIVSSQDAYYVMAYSNVGLSPDGGGSWHLSRLLPKQLALEIMLTGEKISAPRLHQLGVINRLCDKGTALSTALDWAERIASRASNVSASIKELVCASSTQPLSEQLKLEQQHFVNNLHHANGGEGISAFLEKRPPQFKADERHTKLRSDFNEREPRSMERRHGSPHEKKL